MQAVMMCTSMEEHATFCVGRKVCFKLLYV